VSDESYFLLLLLPGPAGGRESAWQTAQQLQLSQQHPESKAEIFWVVESNPDDDGDDDNDGGDL